MGKLPEAFAGWFVFIGLVLMTIFGLYRMVGGFSICYLYVFC